MINELDLDSWVGNMLDGVPQVRGPKAVHCPVLGTHILHRHEIAILDTPLMQRLRYISQTGFAYLTFPGARHSRLEHTLGAVILAERYAQAINARQDKRVSIGDITRFELRMAALLHDVGHALFSHGSELIYQNEPAFRSLKKVPDFSDSKAHETVSHLIITTKSFRTFFADMCDQYSVRLDLDRIAGWIIGRPDKPESAFLAEIINGPFDVDKLDYIHRDAHATGLRIVVDLDRLFYAVDTVNVKKGGSMKWSPGTHLVLHTAQPLEQLVFSKMMLYSTVYHHHKVKACDCLLAGAIEYAKREGSSLGESLQKHTGFLDLTEGELLANRENPLARRLRDRVLTYRSMEISVNTVEGWMESEGKRADLQDANVNPSIYHLSKFLGDRENAVRNQKELNQQVYDLLPDTIKCSVLPEEIWVDLPEIPKFKEVSLALVLLGEDPIPADQVFPTEGWTNAYSSYRHSGHVFSPRHVVREVYHVAQSVLADRFGIRLKKDSVSAFCHWL